MIESFAIANYKSIKDILVLDFKVSGHLGPEFDCLVSRECDSNISKISFIYGKNGAGKSSIVEGLKDFKNLAINNDEGAIDTLDYVGKLKQKITPFKLGHKVDPISLFSLVFIVKDHQYRYTLTYDTSKNEIVEEQLEVNEKKAYDIIFSKKMEGGFKRLSAIELERLRTYKLEKRSVLSLLYKDINVASPKVFPHIENTYQFLENISFGFDSITKDASLESLYKNPFLQEKITTLIKGFDLSIEDIKIEKREISFDEFKGRYSFLVENPKDQAFQALLRNQYENRNVEYSLNFKHLESYLGFAEESSGTKKIANILYSLHSHHQKVWIIDDFEQDLHTEAVSELLKYIGKGDFDMQFVFITHELGILDLEAFKNKNLHFFVEKNEETLSTNIIKMSQFKDLKSDHDHTWSKFYKELRLGQYPAIQINKEEFLNLFKEMRGED